MLNVNDLTYNAVHSYSLTFIRCIKRGFCHVISRSSFHVDIRLRS